MNGEQLINILISFFVDDLAREEPYKSKIGSYTYLPTSAKSDSNEFQNNDAIGNLMTFCQHRQLPLPSYDVFCFILVFISDCLNKHLT